MNIRELKQSIIDKTLDNSMMIFECPNDYFLATQYIKEIANLKELEINYVSSPIVGAYTNYLNVYTVDNFEDDIAPTDNLIVRCIKSSNSNLDKYVTSFPSLEHWQVENYAICNLPEMEEAKVKWLCENAKYDLYTIENEINKLNIFDSKSADIIFNELNDSDAYSYLSTYTMFDFINAVLKRDKTSALEISKYINYKDSLAIVNYLETNLRNILIITTLPHILYTELGISSKQYYFIKNNLCGHYSPKELATRIKFISKLDKMLKCGIIYNEDIIDYIMVNVL